MRGSPKAAKKSEAKSFHVILGVSDTGAILPQGAPRLALPTALISRIVDRVRRLAHAPREFYFTD